MAFTKILCGVDFSEQSEQAVNEAMLVARHTGADIVLLHVGAIPPDEPGALPATTQKNYKVYREILAQQLAEDRDALGKLRERLDGQGPRISHVLSEGFADTAICKAAKELKADLVVVGSHGRTGLRRLLIGSIAERVIRLNESDVLVARGESPGAGGYAKILVPTDFSETANQALTRATQIAAPGAQIDLFHTWELPPGASIGFPAFKATTEMFDSVRSSIRTNVNSIAKELIAKYKDMDVVLSFEDVEMNAHRAIQERLEKGGYDLVVMGSHGRRGLRRFILGSVAEVTVRHAPCSAMVVHSKKDD